MRSVVIFAPPPNGLVAYCINGRTWYGIYIGIEGDHLRLFSPNLDGSIKIPLEDEEFYSCQLGDFDYQLLARLGRHWCKDVLVEYREQRFEVADIRRRYPVFNNDILVHLRTGQEIVISDPELKFVGHA